YLAPGVYVEETSYRAKSIEGVSTSTAGFVGPARYGPASGLPWLVTSFTEFERVFGGLDRLEFEGENDRRTHNYLAHAVRGFFDNGGKRVYVARVFGGPGEGDPALANDGHAAATFGGVTVRARFPGRAGRSRVSFTFRVGGNVLATQRDPVTGATFNALRGVVPDDVVWVADPTSPPGDNPTAGTLTRAERYFDAGLGRNTWRLHPASGGAIGLESLVVGGDRVYPLSVTVEVTFTDRVGNVLRRDTFENLGFTPGARGALGTVFAPSIPSRSTELRTPIVMTAPGLTSGPALAEALLGLLPDVGDNVFLAGGRSFERALEGGSDGYRPRPEDYEGESRNDGLIKTGLVAMEDIPDVSIVAAPGYSAADNQDAQAVSNALISHAERMRYRIAVLDAGEGFALSEVRAQRAQLDSAWAALYYPWVRVLDPVTDEEIVLPPSGFVTGIYARNDVEKGVHKAPANEVVRGALGFEVTLNKGQQDVLNPEGINCFRFFEGRGNRLWGARTASSDPEWKYVNLRRYFAYLERSIERGTQWAVFENNSEPLWANVRRTVEDFLYNEWSQAHLMGSKPEQAYFVRCDRTTMTQNDFDNGRLVCLIGVAPVRPAEFVIFRIGQWTGDAKR
ncbi:MAG TPA: phage tail sheath subtilisin-like domain-containing protein, partial [Longimicrobium sp.]|nr:phage tail sheath subtilisin-like domain-containing protein [Longimicrobium sp.]